MPTEERFIKFTLNEVVEALKILSERGKFSLPKTSVKSAKEIVLADGELAVEFKFNGANEYVVIPNAFVAAALISFCGRFKIPIPKQANKCLGVMGQSMMLRISSDGTIASSSQQSKNNLTKKKCGKETNEQEKSNDAGSEEFLL
jgi:hypothetical protein